MNRAFIRRLSLVGAATALLIAAAPALAQSDTAGYAAWTMGGTGGAYTGTMTLPGNFPAATFTSDGRAASSLQTGANVWLNANTPFGAAYGSSRNLAYPLIRPVRDAPGNPSKTTYTFDEATPSSGWGFALGDIDADTVTITATGADGGQVPASALGYQGSFNFCETSPKPNACSGVTTFHTPTWTAGTSTLAGDGNDETGGTGWFQPTVPISTLTFSFSALSGFPVYQTWFAKTAIDDPTTDEPTTDGPTTDEPTTDGPTTDGPTTDGPTTDGPTSEEPTTDGPGGTDGPTSGPLDGEDTSGGMSLVDLGLPITGAPLLTAILSGLAALGTGVLIMALVRRRRVES